MFAKIKINKGAYKTLYYNEQKIKEGKAECLAAENFVKDLECLSWKDKLFHFERLSSLYERVRKNTPHISLNFHPSDKLSDSDMINIARYYMAKMEFHQQPYLIYKHNDTVHPHLHIVSTNITNDGKKITLHKKDYYNSKKITQDIERSYSLTPSNDKTSEKKNQDHTHAQKIRYGQISVTPAISSIIDKIITQYKYTSLPEFNTLLRAYNVQAYEGKTGSRLQQHRGLIYRVLDDQGRPTSSQIKASVFHSKPTLSRLEKEFSRHRWNSQRQQQLQYIISAIDRSLTHYTPDLNALERSLGKEKISMIVEKDRQGRPQNIFYIDQQANAIFDSRSLDRSYQLAILRQRCIDSRLLPIEGEKQAPKQEQIQKQTEPQLQTQEPGRRHLPIQRREQTPTFNPGQQQSPNKRNLPIQRREQSQDQSYELDL